jgi:acyl dehydratase
VSVEVLPLSAGNREPEVTVSISRQDIAKYAGASGDFNLVHVDEEFAQEAGYESVFAMGMLTAGIAGSLVNHWLGVENVRSFDARFESIVFPGDDLSYVAEVTSEDDGVVTAEFTTTNQDGEVVLSGETSAVRPDADEA